MSSLSIYPSIKLFADVARQYCAWAEGEFCRPQEEMQHARKLLAELHLAVMGLPDLEIEKDDEDATRLSHDEWSHIFQKFVSLPIESYWDVFNPLEEREPILNSLADDLADIYRDVKRGLVLYEAHHSLDAAWDWRFNFQIHWGHHLVGAQRAIHEYLSGENL
jgi:Domain of unknown function (DUF5063)